MNNFTWKQMKRGWILRAIEIKITSHTVKLQTGEREFEIQAKNQKFYAFHLSNNTGTSRICNKRQVLLRMKLYTQFNTNLFKAVSPCRI